ncbi:lantibiotic dehydratase [Actinoalloteichus caeruleus]|uniref:lantibiotic dehydratase n=1 Tax=Actinoalloteichus cyanogriseus TaxID=2893586 RepID=UPI003BB853DB
MVRAVAEGDLRLPPWPVLEASGADAVTGWVAWLRQVWGVEAVRDAIGHASPVLAGRIRSLCAASGPSARKVRRAVLSMMRYLARTTGRPTPNGLFAGVAAVQFGSVPYLRCGNDHEAVAGAEAGWLAEVIRGLEGTPAVLARLAVVTNTTLVVRGERLVVPYQPVSTDQGTGAVEVELRYTGPVRAAVRAARRPLRFDDLRTTIEHRFPHAGPNSVVTLLTTLVAHRVLVTNLHAPSTEPDPLGHLVRELAPVAAAASEQYAALNDLHRQLQQHRHSTVEVRRALRAEACARMNTVAPVRRTPVAVDLRLDLEVVLPETLAREAERAALLLARLASRPGGTAAWSDYHRRFYQRFGSGTQVPLLAVTADSGIGWPAGYPGTTAAAARPQRTPRDERLLTIAQSAALDGQHEVVLDEALIAELEAAPLGSARLPSHLELCARVDARSVRSLREGRFQLAVTSVSRSAGVLTGRFLHLLGQHDRQRFTSPLRASSDPHGSLPVQLSFPPLDPATAHVTRCVQVLPTVLSLAEHRDTTSTSVLTAADLAISCDQDRLYLTAPALGVRVEAWSLHALNLRKHTPPLARFLIELTRAHCAEVTEFDWGTAATLPFLPRLRSGRVVLSPARWRLRTADFPGPTAAWTSWDAVLTDWRERRRLPRRVFLVDGDWRLPLDLSEEAHRVLLREHCTTNSHAVLEEGPAENVAGWLDGRAHEVVIPLSAHQRPAARRPPRPTVHRLVQPDEHGLPPGASPLLFAKLYGAPNRQNIVLAEHLPALLAEWGEDQPQWWFLRFREGDEHYLRLRIALPTADPAAFGEAAGRVSAWTNRLRRLGLLREVVFATSYPETGRWGSGAALSAAEAVLTADSRAVLNQLAQPERPHPHALAAANFAAIALAFTGDPEIGMRWLVDHIPAKPPSAVPRAVFNEARRLADPDQDFRVLRAEPGGAAIVGAWAERAEALAGYRAGLSGPDAEGVDLDAALGSVMHTHFLRACGTEPEDKAVCHYLARTAALTVTARAEGPR